MIEVSVREGEGVLVGLWGEFDLYGLERLRDVLDGVTEVGCPVEVDLSGVTFLDLQTTRELAVRSQLFGHRLALGSPSEAVLASITACGLEPWFDFRPKDAATVATA